MPIVEHTKNRLYRTIC